MSLRQQVVHSLSWNMIGRVSGQACQLVFTIILARMLSPSEFGAIGMLIVFTGFAQVLSDSGINSALIYNQRLTEAHRSTAFWTQAGIGVALTLFFFFGAKYIAIFYSLPILAPLTRLISLAFILQSLGQTQYALLSKELKFRSLALTSVGVTLVSGVVAIIMAQRGFGVWALAWQMLVVAGGSSLSYWLLSAWRPRFMFHRDSVVELGRYSVYLLGHGTINYWMRNGDNLIIGKVLGASALGVYARAYQLMLLPLSNISIIFGQVMLPALSRVQTDIPRFSRMYLSAIRLIAFVAFPLMTGLGILSFPLVAVLLGPKWAEVAPILRILSVVGLVQSIVAPVAWVFSGLGRTKRQFQLSIFLGFAFALAMVIGIKSGIMGVVYAYTVWTVLSASLNLYVVGKYINLSILAIALSVSRITAMTVVMGAIIFWTDFECIHRISDIERLVVGVTVGVVAYLGLCVLTRDEAFFELLDIFGVRRKQKHEVIDVKVP